MAANYTVMYAHYCGNTWDVSTHGTDLPAAIEAAEKIHNVPFVGVYDADDPERGYFTDADVCDCGEPLVEGKRESGNLESYRKVCEACDGLVA